MRALAQQVDETIAFSERPVVMGDLHYLELHHYVQDTSRGQFVRLTPRHPSFTTEYAHRQDPGEYWRWSEMIGRYAGFTPVGLDEWVGRHATFTVLAANERDWILEACRKRGAVIEAARNGDPEFRFFEVRMAGAAVSGVKYPLGSVNNPLRIFEGWQDLAVTRDPTGDRASPFR